jgi:hypothetical protein
MTAQEMIIDYAAKTTPDGFTAQQWAGKMMAEGAVISRDSNSRTFARISRQGKTIVVTETTIAQTEKMAQMQNGMTGITRGEDVETTVEIMRIEL